MQLRPAPPGYRPYEIGFDLNQGFGAPQVAYRETLGRRAEIDYAHSKHLGPMSQFARVMLVLEPLPPDSGFVFKDDIVGGSIPKEFIPGVEKGLRAVAGSGPLRGFPVIDFQASLIDGAYHEVDSSMVAFEIAARVAFREASEKVAMRLLQPILKMEIVSPNDHVRTVIGDLNSRRGVILGQAMRGDATVISALAPYANLLNYAAGLQNATDGKARCSGDLAGLAVVPGDRDPPPAVAQRMTA